MVHASAAIGGTLTMSGDTVAVSLPTPKQKQGVGGCLKKKARQRQESVLLKEEIEH
jgi:hypothetical protein